MLLCTKKVRWPRAVDANGNVYVAYIVTFFLKYKRPALSFLTINIILGFPSRIRPPSAATAVRIELGSYGYCVSSGVSDGGWCKKYSGENLRMTGARALRRPGPSFRGQRCWRFSRGPSARTRSPRTAPTCRAGARAEFAGAVGGCAAGGRRVSGGISGEEIDETTVFLNYDDDVLDGKSRRRTAARSPCALRGGPEFEEQSARIRPSHVPARGAWEPWRACFRCPPPRPYVTRFASA